jgi:hypothetical protein
MRVKAHFMKGVVLYGLAGQLQRLELPDPKNVR